MSFDIPNKTSINGEWKLNRKTNLKVFLLLQIQKKDFEILVLKLNS